MNRKRIISLMMAVAISSSIATPAMTVKAEGLTQTTDAKRVVYGSISNSDIEILKSVFDFEYYKASNPDLVAVLGDNYDSIFAHFYLRGIFEGRTCNPNFDPAAYASAYGDLKEKFGTDIVKYYQHYALVGSKEDRPLTTIAACAEAGITVESISDESIKISPEAYAIAIQMGTTDFVTVQKAVNRVTASLNNAVSHSDETSSSDSSNTNASADENVTIPEAQAVVIESVIGEYVLATGFEDAYARAKGLKQVAKFKAGDRYLVLWLVEGSEGGYAVYNRDDLDEEKYPYGISMHAYSEKSKSERNEALATMIPIYKTDDYQGTPEKAWATQLSLQHNTAIYSTYYNDELNGGNNQKKTESLNKDIFGGTITYDPADDKEVNFIECWNDKGWGMTNFEVEATDYMMLPYWKPDRRDYLAVDRKGDLDSVYNVGIDIKQDENGKLQEITVGLSNDETKFGEIYSARDTEEGKKAIEEAQARAEAALNNNTSDSSATTTDGSDSSNTSSTNDANNENTNTAE